MPNRLRGRRPLRSIGTAVALTAGFLALPLLLETRLAKPEQPADDSWKQPTIKSRGTTLLGISFRPRQIEAFGLDVRATLNALLAFPFELIRLAAYWDQIERQPSGFDTSELDWQLESAQRAGKQVILSVGAVKNFGYPEYFVPSHALGRSLREGSLVRPDTHATLLAASRRFITRIVTRYRDNGSIVAWQLEHEAVDPLGVEHSWRLAVDFVQGELEAIKAADPSRPVMMNGFLPTSSLVRLSQSWRTRDQGDSLAVATRLADVVGIDFYPRHALTRLGPRTLYLDGGGLPWQRTLTGRLLDSVARQGKPVMVAEGQSEPWETVTTPPSPDQQVMYSCRPEHLIENYNTALSWSRPDTPLYAYLFWGAEYWILRDQSGDSSYLQAFERVLGQARA